MHYAKNSEYFETINFNPLYEIQVLYLYKNNLDITQIYNFPIPVCGHRTNKVWMMNSYFDLQIPAKGQELELCSKKGKPSPGPPAPRG